MPMIHVVTVAQFFGGAFGHQFAGRIFFFGQAARALHGAELDTLLVFFALDDAIDKMPGV